MSKYSYSTNRSSRKADEDKHMRQVQFHTNANIAFSYVKCNAEIDVWKLT
jgi:hypothetical protein